MRVPEPPGQGVDRGDRPDERPVGRTGGGKLIEFVITSQDEQIIIRASGLAHFCRRLGEHHLVCHGASSGGTRGDQALELAANLQTEKLVIAVGRCDKGSTARDDRDEPDNPAQRLFK